ncbi:MAG TPA: capsule assembly Wzi family protein [Kofleriaceae bacterium]|nr:capsule assembly Wzi family protein [Kofleriaceae bacterium]
MGGRGIAIVAGVLLAGAPAIAAPDGGGDGADGDGAWIEPITRAALDVDVVHEAARPYSTPARPRNVTGAIALSCAYRAGRPCGNGDGAFGELDAAAGVGPWLAAVVGLRVHTGRAAYTTGVEVDRAYVTAALGPIAVAAGRDVLVLGPAVRTVPSWGTNAPPLDQLRVATTRPLAIAPWLGVEAVYVVGRLADPQTYPGSLVSIARGQLDLGDRVQLGATQLLELGGDGAPHLGPIDFVLEHVRRRDASASASDSSNRRFGLDAALRLDALGGARVVYQIMFEDLRAQPVSAIRFDADHALSLTTRWATLEWRRTGQRSYEHAPRVTGFTSGGFIVGDPLGPAAQAVFASAPIAVATSVVTPWIELAQLDSDSFNFDPDGPIVRTARGPSEFRFRLGAQARVPLSAQLELAPEAALEAVERFAYRAGARRINTVLRASLIWRPRLRFGI